MSTPLEAVADGLRALETWNTVNVPDAVFAALSSAGFEILPTALVDAVLDAAATAVKHGRFSAYNTALTYATHDIKVYRRAPVLLGQTEETPR